MGMLPYRNNYDIPRSVLEKARELNEEAKSLRARDPRVREMFGQLLLVDAEGATKSLMLGANIRQLPDQLPMLLTFSSSYLEFLRNFGVAEKSREMSVNYGLDEAETEFNVARSSSASRSARRAYDMSSLPLPLPLPFLRLRMELRSRSSNCVGGRLRGTSKRCIGEGEEGKGKGKGKGKEHHGLRSWPLQAETPKSLINHAFGFIRFSCTHLGHSKLLVEGLVIGLPVGLES
jgi:hypothetical protein